MKNTWQNIMESLAIIRGNRRAFFGFIGVLFFILMGTIGPVIIPLDMTADYMGRFQPPSFGHILGTDYAGRDILQQIIHGSRDIMLIAFSTAVFAILLAVIIGILAGLVGGWVDMVIMRAIDVFLTVPAFPIMAIFAALFRIRDPVTFGLVLAIWSWPGLARAIRSQILSLRKREFIEAAEVMGMSTAHIMFRELLPNMTPYITINFINIAKSAITASVGIMLLGLVPLS
ncbi:MAG: ABC transporter permease, partial [Candidatus Eremiobacteraeota bacterium]|nr:ABC transporter permease [Candidatus Eremiobacteraeota bacterium]